MHPNCFSGPATAFHGLDFWSQATVKGGTAAQGKAAQGRTVRAVTQPRTGFRFHFAKLVGVGGHWELIFIDLRKPCIAWPFALKTNNARLDNQSGVIG